MKEIQLTQGQVALVDDEDYEWLNSFKWYAHKIGNTFYAARHIRVNGKQKHQHMHQLIMGDNPLKLMIDHRDGNGLNNQRSNLRFCTHQENQMNQRPRKNSSSVYKGVCWFKRDHKWMAQIRIYGKLIYLGCFDHEEDAAKAYDEVVIKHFGEFAVLNF